MGAAPGTGDTGGGTDTDVPDGRVAGAPRTRHHRHHDGHQRTTETEQAGTVADRRRNDEQDGVARVARGEAQERAAAQTRQVQPTLEAANIPDAMQHALLAQTRGTQGERTRVPWLREARTREPTATPSLDTIRIGAMTEQRPRTAGPDNGLTWGRLGNGPAGILTLNDVADVAHPRQNDPRARQQGR